LRIETIATARPEPVRIGNAHIASRLARAAPRTVILQSAIHVVRPAHIDSNRVELCRHDSGVDELPCVTAIVADVQAAVIADHDVVAILWIDPDGVMIAVGDAGLQ